MNEVTKLYESAGIKPTHYDACVLEDKYWNNGELANQYGTFDRYLSFECPHYGEGCYSTCEYAYDKDEYPPFTAKKQLELIKWIAEYKEECRITYEKEYKWCTQTDWQSSFCYDNFSASLANLINTVWQDLTEAEKQQIKNILESEVRE